MMQFIFILICLLSGMYFVFLRKKADLLFVAFSACVIYFMPGFFGYTAYHIKGVWLYSDIIDKTYFVFIFVILAVTFWTLLIHDFLFRILRLPQRGIEGDVFVEHIMMGLAVVGFVVTLYASGQTLFSLDKGQVLSSVGRGFILLVFSSSLLAVISFSNKHYFFMLTSLGFLGFCLYIGFRSPVVMVFISLILLKGCRDYSAPLRVSPRLISFGVIAVLFVFLYKEIGHAVKEGDILSILHRLSSKEVFVSSVGHSEPFIIQSTLNEVLSVGYSVPSSMLTGVWLQFIIFGNMVTSDILSFNDYFQPDLFPSVEYGMASNIWAQFIALGGVGGFALFVIFYVLSLSILSSLISISKGSVRACIVLISSYWVFYIHRNDIGYQLNLEKRIILVYLSVLILSVLVFYATNYLKRYRGGDVA